MSTTSQTARSPDSIPEQKSVTWALAFSVGWGSLKRRFFRSLVTMLGVVLAVSFLTYMVVSDGVTSSLVAANQDELNRLLQEANVDIFSAGQTDRMTVLLIGLSLLTCLVGIINSMLMAVTERIREIGTLKCLGALDSFIVKTYFIESSVQGLMGTVMGMIIGLVVALATAVKSFHGWVFTCFPYGAVGKALALAFVMGAVLSVAAAILPAYWAAKKEPVEAMRVDQ